MGYWKGETMAGAGEVTKRGGWHMPEKTYTLHLVHQSIKHAEAELRILLLPRGDFFWYKIHFM